ncbi:unnamed protein product [Urochloa humidicola]
MATTASDSALPNWVMLENFIFRRDDPKFFCEDRRSFASGTTSAGTHFDVSFILAEAPTPSRLYLSWPEGPKQEGVYHLVAANRNLVLLRLDYLVDESRPFGAAVHDYFIYIADPSSQQTPLLRLLPHCTEDNAFLGVPLPRSFSPLAIGLLCHGEDQFVVAHLEVIRCPVTSQMKAEMWMLRSSSCSDDDAKWETMLLPIQYQDDEYLDFLYWLVNDVVPFKNSLCWVDYSRGILLCEGIFEDKPNVSYIRFPLDPLLRVNLAEARKGLYRSLCVTECGRRLVVIDVSRHDGRGFVPMVPDTGFTLTSRTLKITVNGIVTTQWEWIDDAVVTSDQLWRSESLPHDSVMLPLLSVDKAMLRTLYCLTSLAGSR